MIAWDASNLSLIIQGPFNNDVSNIVDYYVYKFPLIEIIIVSWEIDYIKYKKIVSENSLNIKIIIAKDPGGQISFNNEKLNVNRQLLSTRLGVQNVSKKYCIKTRSDFKLNLNKTINQYNKYNRVNITDTQNRESILIINLTSENPVYSGRFFSFCDWLYLGLSEDIEKLIMADPYPNEFLTNKNKKKSSLRYNAEQWMLLKGLLGADFDIIMPNSYSVSNTVIKSYYHALKSIIILRPSKIGLESFKYNFLQFRLSKMYTFKEWKKLYYENYTYILDIERVCYNFHEFLFKIKKLF